MEMISGEKRERENEEDEEYNYRCYDFPSSLDEDFFDLLMDCDVENNKVEEDSENKTHFNFSLQRSSSDSHTYDCIETIKFDHYNESGYTGEKGSHPKKSITINKKKIHYSEDRSIMISLIIEGKKFIFIALADGHGGTFTISKDSIRDCFDFISRRKSTFRLNMDFRVLINEIYEYVHMKCNSSYIRGGSTLIVAFIGNGKCHFGNLGDSVGLIINDKDYVFTTNSHNIDNKEEHARLISTNEIRFVNKHNKVCAKGPYIEMKSGNKERLAVFGGIGDMTFDKVMRRIPDYSQIDIDSDFIIILSSDWIYEFLTSKKFGEQIEIRKPRILEFILKFLNDNNNEITGLGKALVEDDVQQVYEYALGEGRSIEIAKQIKKSFEIGHDNVDINIFKVTEEYLSDEQKELKTNKTMFRRRSLSI